MSWWLVRGIWGCFWGDRAFAGEPAGSRPGSRVPFGLIQKEPKDQARTALAPWLRQGVPGFAPKPGVGQKLPAFASLTPVKQSARVSSRSALARAPLPLPQTRRRRGAKAKLPTANPSYPLAACSQPLEVRYSAVGFGCSGSAPFAHFWVKPKVGRLPGRKPGGLYRTAANINTNSFKTPLRAQPS